MRRKRVLLLEDFSRQGYAAHHAVPGMHASEGLHLVLLVVKADAGFRDTASALAFGELMAAAHISRGAVAEVVMSDGDAASAVRRELSRHAFDFVVAGDNLADCRSDDSATEWLSVDAFGHVSRCLDTHGGRKTRMSSKQVDRFEIGSALAATACGA